MAENCTRTDGLWWWISENHLQIIFI